MKLEFTLPDIREVSRLKGEVVGKKLERQERQMETTRMITERCADLKREIQDYADKLRLLVDSLQLCSENLDACSLKKCSEKIGMLRDTMIDINKRTKVMNDYVVGETAVIDTLVIEAERMDRRWG